MATFDPLGGSQTTRPAAQSNTTAQPPRDTPRTAATQTETPVAVEPTERSADGNATGNKAAASLPARAGGFSARLSYDEVSDDVVVEILDPQTGEVLRQLPAEDASRELRGGSGQFIDKVA